MRKTFISMSVITFLGLSGCGSNADKGGGTNPNTVHPSHGENATAQNGSNATSTPNVAPAAGSAPNMIPLVSSNGSHTGVKAKSTEHYEAPISGMWVTDCTKDGSGFSKSYMNFLDAGVVISGHTFTDKQCSIKQDVIRVMTNARAVETNALSYQIMFNKASLKDVMVTPESLDQVKMFNASKTCGQQDWRPGVTVSAKGTECMAGIPETRMELTFSADQKNLIAKSCYQSPAGGQMVETCEMSQFHR